MRRSVSLACACVWAIASCGPDHRRCSGPHPDFVVTLELRDRPLPANTVVNVEYAGSGVESYALASPPSNPEVVFCTPVRRRGTSAATEAAAGEAGAAQNDDMPVDALKCELWTAGFTTLRVRGEGLADTRYELSPDEEACTVNERIELDQPDAG